MQISALVSMSWKTPILNDGDRFNGTNPKTTNIAGPEAGITGNPLYMRLFLKDD